MIAALFVQTNGSYFGIPGIDPWDEQRDARKYPGPYPVIAHPPCQRWGKLWAGQPLWIKRTGQRKIKGDDIDYEHIGRTFYTLYNIHPIDGFLFNYFRADQRKYQDEHISKPHGYIEKMQGFEHQKDDAEYELYLLRKQLEPQPLDNKEENTKAKLTVVT